MKVLLIIPKKNKSTILPAPDIGIAYLGRSALNAGASVTVLDAHKNNVGPDRIVEYLKGKSFDLIGIKCLSVDFYNSLEYCRRIKGYSKNIITVLGSYHPSALPDMVKQYPDIDYIIRGEGELGLANLIQNPDRQKRVIIESALAENLDALGFPAWHLFNINEYPILPGSGGRFLPIITSRGCPANCTFCCSYTIHGKKIRKRSIESVMEEIRWLIKDFRVQKISIFDDNFTFYKEHTMKFCELYIKNKFPVNFDIPQGVRMDGIDKEALLALETAGCSYMGIGIESGEQKTLDLIKKGTVISQIEEKINLIKKYSHIKLMGFFIIGFPHETENDILKTLDFSLKLKLDYAAFTIFTPFPGTALFDQMLKEGYFSIDTFKWDDLLLDRETFKHKKLSRDRLKKLQRKAYFKFYFRWSKIGFFFRVIFREGSFMSYFKRFVSILKR